MELRSFSCLTKCILSGRQLAIRIRCFAESESCLVETIREVFVLRNVVGSFHERTFRVISSLSPGCELHTRLAI